MPEKMGSTVEGEQDRGRALVLLSGGLDSTTCMALADRDAGRGNVTALSVYYGQRHDREVQAARLVAEYYEAEHICIDLTPAFQFSDSSLMKGSEAEIPETSYAEQLKMNNGAPVSTYVPFRNGLFLSTAAAIAESRGCASVYYGVHADDAAGNAYPDCSESFHQAMAEAIRIGSGTGIRLYAPFTGMTKAEVVKIGLELGAPYRYTWSCYEGDDVPCGRCATCLDRAEAFRLNGAEDPALKYYTSK